MENSLIELPNNHIGVEVPEDTPFPALYYFVGTDNTLYGNYGQLDLDITYLPPGRWSIVGLSDELSEEQWSGIVDGNKEDGCKEYISEVMRDVPYTYAKESGHSLLKSLGQSRLLILHNSKMK